MSDPAISISDIEQVLQRYPGVSEPGDVHFLARGEYTWNYRFSDRGRDLVIRLVTGSQMGLSLPAQVAYEVRALRLLGRSGRTPGFVGMELEPVGLIYPYLIIDYLPGRPLNYQTDLIAAAECIAVIHRLGAPDDHGLQVMAEPQRSTVVEAEDLAATYFDWADAPQDSAREMADLFERVKRRVTTSHEHAAGFDLAIVNTDLNSHNFVVDEGYVRLLDWEKARIGPAVQDLAHFLIPTTTLWRASTATVLSEWDQTRFVDAYLAGRPELDRKRFIDELEIAKSLAALRAIAWCAWSIQASATGERAITNVETLERSRSYLKPDFLNAIARY